MNDETTKNGDDSKDDVQTILDEIEKRLDANDLKFGEFQAMMLKLAFQAAKQRQRASDEIAEIRAVQAETQKNLNHITQLIKFFGDKSFEFHDKLTKAGNIVLEGFTATENAAAYLESEPGKKQVIKIINKATINRELLTEKRK